LSIPGTVLRHSSTDDNNDRFGVAGKSATFALSGVPVGTAPDALDDVVFDPRVGDDGNLLSTQRAVSEVYRTPYAKDLTGK
jgi:hypothetical protein